MMIMMANDIWRWMGSKYSQHLSYSWGNMHKFTQLFLYCSGGEHNAKCVHPALKMEASKEEQRSVVRFLVAEGVAIHHTVKTSQNAVGRNHPFCMITPIPTPPIWWGISFRDLAGKHLNILRSAKIFPLVSSTFLATWRKTSVDVGFIRTRKYKSGWGCGFISDLSHSTSLELIVSSPSEINVAH